MAILSSVVICSAFLQSVLSHRCLSSVAKLGPKRSWLVNIWEGNIMEAICLFVILEFFIFKYDLPRRRRPLLLRGGSGAPTGLVLNVLLLADEAAAQVIIQLHILYSLIEDFILVLVFLVMRGIFKGALQVCHCWHLNLVKAKFLFI